MSDDRKLLWCDLETTGSDDTDEIIELGCLMTDSKLTLVPGFEYSWIVKCGAEASWHMLQEVVVREMHAKNGLLWEVVDGNGTKREEVEQNLLSRLRAIEPKNRQVMIAGSGVGHFDRRMIRKWMPELDKYLHYAPFDIGNIRRALKAWDIPIPMSGNKDIKTHRALDDAKLHLEEARAYKALFEKLNITNDPDRMVVNDTV